MSISKINFFFIHLSLPERIPRNVFLFDILSPSATATAKEMKITLVSVLSAMPPMPFLVKMCPPLTKKNAKFWQPLLAVGSPNGFLYIYNLNQNQLVRKLQMYTQAILGIEWCSTFMLITWANSSGTMASVADAGGGGGSGSVSLSSSSAGGAAAAAAASSVVGGGGQATAVAGRQMLVRNEVLLTDLRTGESIQFRPGGVEESPITSIKLSNLRQYLVVLFKEQPLEIWDMKSFSIIKRISKKSPNIINLVSFSN